MVKLERIYTVPLGKAYEAVRGKRTPRAVKMLRAFIARHMKADGKRILISQNLNNFLWARSIQKPPRKVKVRLIKDEGAVRAYLADEKVEEPQKAEEKEKGAKEEKKEEPKPEKEKETKPETGKQKQESASEETVTKKETK